MNTCHLASGEDDLETPQHLQAWLVAHQLLTHDQSVSEADWRDIIQMREALRRLLFANNGGDLESEAITTLNHAASRAGLVVQCQTDGHTVLVPGGAGVAWAVADLVGRVFAAQVEGTWSRLKACRDERCLWVFYDTSKNQCGTWCDMAVCGSRHKARSYRKRRRAAQEE